MVLTILLAASLALAADQHGIGRESPIDGSIRVYDPKTGQPLYEIRSPRR